MEVIILDLIPFMNIYFYLNVLFNDPYVFILYLTNEVNSLHQHKFRKIPCICASIVAQNIFVPMVPKVTFGGSFGFGCLNLRWKLWSSVNSAFGRSLVRSTSRIATFARIWLRQKEEPEPIEKKDNKT